MDVSEIRSANLDRRRGLEPSMRLVASKAIAASLSGVIGKAKNIENILCFYPLPDEVDLRELYKKLLAVGKRLYFPVTGGEDISFFEVGSLSDFSEGKFSVMEPVSRERAFEPADAGKAIAIVPGVCFDRQLNRIGFGKGYYDRFLARAGSDLLKVGVCFRTNLYGETLPVHEGDVPMDMIITEVEEIGGI